MRCGVFLFSIYFAIVLPLKLLWRIQFTIYSLRVPAPLVFLSEDRSGGDYKESVEPKTKNSRVKGSIVLHFQL